MFMSRIEKVRAQLAAQGLDALVVTNLKNIRYLANFTGTTAALIITSDQAIFVTDFRYVQQASKQAPDFTLLQNKKEIFAEINDFLVAHKIQKVGIEADEMNVSTYLRIKDFFGPEVVPTQGLIEKIREIKDADELATMKKACEITDQAFSHILTFIKPGVTEIEVANELERYLKTLGASAMSFDTIIASGLRSAMPHGVASDKVIEEGDVVTLDFGCYYQGYSSDMTRTIAVGSIDPKLEEIYHVVLEAHNLVNQKAKAGMTGAELDAIARDYISEKGYGQYFGHSLGHGVGLDIHEAPGVNAKNDQPVEVGMVITNEPGIYRWCADWRRLSSSSRPCRIAQPQSKRIDYFRSLKLKRRKPRWPKKTVILNHKRWHP